jgi:antagonist of KipI
MSAQILRSGPLASVQDFGRFGHRGIGVGPGGALDPFAGRIANLLVGNEEKAALIEITLGSFRVRFTDTRVIAWCGGAFQAQVGLEKVPAGRAFLVGAGDELVAAAPQVGCRMWLAIAGGVDVPSVLGSRATDLRAGFGGFEGRPLRDGDDLPLGEIRALNRTRMSALRDKPLSNWSAQHEWANPAARYPVLRIVRGADWNRFDVSTHRDLTSEKFTVTPEADRMGVRLEGPELKRKDARDLVSQAVAPGTMQVPPSGKPILLLGDCQTIGGYPKIGHVITVDLPAAAQLRPGDEVQFQEISMAEAHSFLLHREEDFERFRIGLELRAS